MAPLYSRFSAVVLALGATNACSSSNDSGKAVSGSGSGGGSSSERGAGGGAAGRGPGTGGGTPGGGGGGGKSTSTSGGAGGGAIGSGTGGGATLPGADAGSGSPVTECYGIPLPPRAVTFSSKPPAALGSYSLSTALRTATATQAGFDEGKLKTAVAFATPHSHTQGILVMRSGYIVSEQYVPPFTQDTRHESYSMAKSFSSALVGIAIEQKLLTGVTQPVCPFYSDVWHCTDPADAHGRITFEHAMNVETGLKWREDWRSNATGTNDVFLAGANLLDYVLSRPIADEPGTKSRYSTGDPALLSVPIQKSAGKTAYQFAKSVLLDPIGVPGVQWNSDSKGRTTTYAGLQATVREYARFGHLYLRGGEWDGKQVVPRSWVDFTTQVKDRCADRYRYLWHMNPPIRLGKVDPSCDNFPNCQPTSLANLPSDGFFAEGINGQYVFVFPSADLVVVRVATDDAGADYWDDWARGFLEALFDSLL